MCRLPDLGEADIDMALLNRTLWGYDKNSPPTLPMKVEVSVYNTLVTDIDPVNQKVTLDVYFRGHWEDARLKFSSSAMKEMRTSDGKTIARIWRPDFFFQSLETRPHTFPTDNQHILIGQDGSITFSRRVSHAWKKVSSTEDTIQLRPRGVAFNDEGVRNQEFRLPLVSMSHKILETGTGRYSLVSVDYKLARNPHRYILGSFVPVYLAVLVAYLTMWIQKSSLSARMLLLGMLLLAVMVVAQSAQNNMHKTPASTAMDWKLWISFSFILGALVECVAMEYFEGTKGMPGVTSRMETISRLAYPILYVLFLIIYWISCAA
ncbi:unnamed protein product [Darwinula stevensoni]|uniref:Neurotransmitter-gated ion-channel ligand-binding domain-containing protein n=1 Tax=Darwinula stevensoni TaxID=69355 RepID=A0A7R9A1Y6_9CRUS|nr:unnamed protein product [Darwinula stevensoni]CAG0887586.1 unnamed protein product [Darwinula stevensoni]